MLGKQLDNNDIKFSLLPIIHNKISNLEHYNVYVNDDNLIESYTNNDILHKYNINSFVIIIFLVAILFIKLKFYK